jgi:tetratricopeptide (TPR) repeat protein
MAIISSANAQKERKFIRHGNKEYNKAIIDSNTVDTTFYQKAEVDYRKALDKNPNNWDASYNLANAIYKQGKYEDAIHQYQATTGMSINNKEKLAKAFHNLGNSYLQTNKIDEAIEAYKNSLRNNPNSLDTKYNLAWAQNKKRQQQQNKDKNKQDKNKQDKNKDQENKDKQDQDKKDKQEQDKKDKQDKAQQNNEQNKNDKQNQQQQQQQEQNQISKEDAMRILEALQNDEKKVQKKVQEQKVQPKKRVIQKDW